MTVEQLMVSEKFCDRGPVLNSPNLPLTYLSTEGKSFNDQDNTEDLTNQQATNKNENMESGKESKHGNGIDSVYYDENGNIVEDFTDDEDDDGNDENPPSDMEDYLDEEGGESHVEDDTKSIVSSSTEFSVGSSSGYVESDNGLAGEGGIGKKKNLVQDSPLVQSSIKPLKRSLFPHVPPTITFMHHNEVSDTPLPAEVRKHLRWKLSTLTPALLKRIITNSGFRLMKKTCTEWGGIWGKHMKSPQFKEIHDGQKLNHMPGTFTIGRKDKLWKNYQKLRSRFGRKEISHLPRTFLLPSESTLLRRVWKKRGFKAKWIVKPPAAARGVGIKVVNKWNQIPKSSPMIVQKYLARPHLINNTKYDLRIYVLLSSICPLRIFLYDDGLVRFASNEYSTENTSLSNVYAHLTNYSINKFSGTYQANEDSESRQGHKWTLKSLWQYFTEVGIDSSPIIESIKDLVIKTIISGENSMYTVFRNNLASNYCGYELFGFDVILDNQLKPWLLEVNITPSLHSGSPLDLDVKSPLATEVFNLARFHIPHGKMSAETEKEVLANLNMGDEVTQLCLDPKLYQKEVSKGERAKQDKFVAAISPESNHKSNEETQSDESNSVDKDENSRLKHSSNSTDSIDRTTYLDSILEKLTPDDVRTLIRSEDELALAMHFSRIFPTQDTHKYLKYFEQPRYYNLLLDAWENKYGGDNRAAAIDRLERLCLEKVHLKVPIRNSSNETKTEAEETSSTTTAQTLDNPQPPLFSKEYEPVQISFNKNREEICDQ